MSLGCRTLIAALLSFTVLSGCKSPVKPYMRNSMVREMNVTASPITEPETATQAEPYPPPRPILPDEPSHLATVPMIRTPERTPVP